MVLCTYHKVYILFEDRLYVNIRKGNIRKWRKETDKHNQVDASKFDMNQTNAFKLKIRSHSTS